MTLQVVKKHFICVVRKQLCECDEWIRANHRRDLIMSKHSKPCVLHFHPRHFVDMHKIRANSKLYKSCLKDDAIPSIYQNVLSVEK